MKTLVIGSKERVEKYKPNLPILQNMEIVYAGREDSEALILEKGADAEYIMVDAISPITRNLIEHMPDLKLIHSEGVAYNAIDLEAAKDRNVFVCNNKGVNAGAVAEQTILLMLALLRNAISGDMDVRQGRQIQTKERMMVEGIMDLADCKVGLIGFGDIAKATAKRLIGFETKVYYYSRSRAPEEMEREYQVTYLPEDELLNTCNIISIHVPVTPATEGMVDKEFLSKMKEHSYFINTARGEIVNQEDLCEALISSRLKGAGFDTLSPEPVQLNNPLLNLPEEIKSRVIFSPHIGGITQGMFFRAHRNVWENIQRVANGELPIHIVN